MLKPQDGVQQPTTTDENDFEITPRHCQDTEHVVSHLNGQNKP